MASLTRRRVCLIAMIGILLTLILPFSFSQAAPPPPPIQLPGESTPQVPQTPHTDSAPPANEQITESTTTNAPPASNFQQPSSTSPPPEQAQTLLESERTDSTPHIEPAPQLKLPNLQPVPLEQKSEASLPPQISSGEILTKRLDRIESRIASIEDRLSTPVEKEIPATPRTPVWLLSILSLLMVAVVYLVWKTSSKVTAHARREESKPLKNVKDYMRRYLVQGYTVQNMKTFLLTQGYPKDLVEQAAQEINTEHAR